MKKKGMGLFVVAVVAAIAYFVYKKSQSVGGVTSVRPTAYGPGPTGLYSQVG